MTESQRGINLDVEQSSSSVTKEENNDDNDTNLNTGSLVPLDSDGDKTANLSKPCGIDNHNIHHEGRSCVYTDPVSKYQYIWLPGLNNWVLRPKNNKTIEENNENCNDKLKTETEAQSQETDDSRSNDGKQNDYEFDGESYCFEDTQSGITYKFDNSEGSWVVKEPKEQKTSEESDKSVEGKVIKQDMSKGTYGFDGNSNTYTSATDGTVYVWDREKNAWFPKVDEDFLAHYQMSYGFSDSAAAAENKESDRKSENDQQQEVGLKRKMAPQDPSWFEVDEEQNTNVYVSNLPLDVTEQEFVDVMQKCGLVMRDAETGKMKIKLYTEPGTNYLKGDGLCTYIKIESVDLALILLDGSDLRGKKLHVERAKFEMKGNYNPNLKPKQKKKKDKEKRKKMQEKLFDWRPDKLRGERSKNEKVVILKNVFDPIVFEEEVSLLLEYQQDLREKCSKYGDVRKVRIYDKHPEGVAQIKFREPEEADACITLLNGSWFRQRKIMAETWDGKTKYVQNC